jgi:hypothetical protein
MRSGILHPPNSPTSRRLSVAASNTRESRNIGRLYGYLDARPQGSLATRHWRNRMTLLYGVVPVADAGVLKTPFALRRPNPPTDEGSQSSHREDAGNGEKRDSLIVIQHTRASIARLKC